MKLTVLDVCLFSSIVYAFEAFGPLDIISQDILQVELNLLKQVLRVKQSTSNDLIFHELNLATILSVLKDKQFKFIEKMNNIAASEALVKSRWDQSRDLSIFQYYTYLENNNVIGEKSQRVQRIQASNFQ